MAAESQPIVWPSERPFWEIAESAPSFGGFFIEGGLLVGLVSDPAEAAAAQDALGSFRATSGDPELAGKQIMIREARYSFRELAEWRDLAFDHVYLPFEDVVSLDLDERGNRVDIGVTDEALDEQLEQILTDLGVPREALAFEARNAMTPASHVTLRDYFRPVRGGFQSFSVDQFGIPIPDPECTAGFNAKLSVHDVVFTASHCTAELWDLDGGGLYQNTNQVPNFLGYEHADPDPDGCGVPGFQHPCRHSDAAAFKYQASVDFDFGYIARPEGPPEVVWGVSGSLVIDDVNPRFRIIGAGDPAQGGEVDKVGRTTGWTRGEVTDTCQHWRSSQDDGERLCQTEADFGFYYGDSGSPVFFVVGDDVYLRGIAWGFDDGPQVSGFSPWSGVVTDFGTLEVALPTMTVSVSAPDTGEPFSWVMATAVVSNGTSPFTYSWTINGSPACGNQSTCDGQLGAEGTYTTFAVSVTDAESEQDSGQKSVFAEWGGCPECPFVRPPGFELSFGISEGEEREAPPVYELPQRDSPDFDRAAGWIMLRAAARGDLSGAERATGYRWGDAALSPFVREILERATLDGEARVAELARRYLEAAGGPS